MLKTLHLNLKQKFIKITNKSKMSTNFQTLFNRAECEYILNKIHAGSSVKPRLKDYAVQPELNSIGFLGQYYHLTLHHAKQGAASVEQADKLFVKTLPFANAELYDYVKNEGILKKEATLYKTLLVELRAFSKNAWCPQCFYIRDDLLVMQNLYELGYEPSTTVAGSFQNSEMRKLLQCLSALHASSIMYEYHKETSIGEVYKNVLKEITVSPKENYFTTGVAAILAIAKQHPQFQDPVQQAYIANELQLALNRVYDMVNPSLKYRNVFCHRDPWGGNVFFNKSKSAMEVSASDDLAAMLVDYQTCRYCPPAIDVVFALNMNISATQRKAEEFQYLTWYYECFEAALSRFDIKATEQISWLEFVESYQEFQLFGLLYKAIAATIISVPNGYLSNMKLQSPEQYYRYAYVDRTADVLQLMADNAQFRQHMQACVADILTLLG